MFDGMWEKATGVDRTRLNAMSMPDSAARAPFPTFWNTPG